MIKKIITSSAIILSSNFAFSQTTTCFIKYSYDNAGNRIKREFVCENDTIPDEPEVNNSNGSSSSGNGSTAKYSNLDSLQLESYTLIYPNPNSGDFWVEFKNITEEKINQRKIFILDNQGKVIMESVLLNLKNQIILTQISSGNYFIVIFDGRSNKTYKITIVK